MLSVCSNTRLGCIRLCWQTDKSLLYLTEVYMRYCSRTGTIRVVERKPGPCQKPFGKAHTLFLQVLAEKGVVIFHQVIAKRKAEKKAAQSQEKAFAENFLRIETGHEEFLCIVLLHRRPEWMASRRA